MSALDRGAVVYPESDGQPMAENETQGRQITRLVQQLDRQFAGRDDVHVGFDLLWYPLEGHPEISKAPDVFVVPGRPARPARGSWRQWEEGGTPMRHVVEILSPKNTALEMGEKLAWYSKYGVEEYIVFDPESGHLEVYERTDIGLAAVDAELPWRSTVLEDCQYSIEHPGRAIEPGIADLVLLDAEGRRIERLDDAVARADDAVARADQAEARVEALEAKLRAAGLEP